MAWICTKCNWSFEHLYFHDFDSEGVCFRCNSNFYVKPDTEAIVRPVEEAPVKKGKHFDVDIWRKKRELLKNAEKEAIDEFLRTGNKGVYFKKLSQIADEQRKLDLPGAEPD